MLLRERTKIVATDGFDVAPFLAIHRCGSGLDVTGGTSFDLDEAKHIFVPSNEIDFSVMPRGREISCNHHVPAAAKRNKLLPLHDGRCGGGRVLFCLRSSVQFDPEGERQFA